MDIVSVSILVYKLNMDGISGNFYFGLGFDTLHRGECQLNWGSVLSFLEGSINFMN